MSKTIGNTVQNHLSPKRKLLKYIHLYFNLFISSITFWLNLITLNLEISGFLSIVNVLILLQGFPPECVQKSLFRNKKHDSIALTLIILNEFAPGCVRLWNFKVEIRFIAVMTTFTEVTRLLWIMFANIPSLFRELY